MSIISLIITVLVMGALLWAVNQYVPLHGKFKKILNAIVVLCAVVWLLSVYGVIG
jgi:hypothetical protein